MNVSRDATAFTEGVAFDAHARVPSLSRIEDTLRVAGTLEAIRRAPGRRDASNDFQLDHWWVSPFHARIVRIDGKLCVIDLSSQEGVHVPLPGGTTRRLKRYEPIDLEAAGYQFLLGPIRVQVELG